MQRTLAVLTRSIVVASVAALLLFTWGLTGPGKLTAGGVPEWFSGQFGQTFLARFPGLAASYYSIALLETVGAILAAGALLRGEWLPGRSAFVLRLALAHSLLVFVQLGFGKRLVSDHDGAHDLFMYAAAALVMLLAVDRLDERQGK